MYSHGKGKAENVVILEQALHDLPRLEESKLILTTHTVDTLYH